MNLLQFEALSGTLVCVVQLGLCHGRGANRYV